MFSAFTGRSRPSQGGDTGPRHGGQPLELVRFNNDTKKFEVGDDALRVLKAVKAPVGVVSVCGRARQGKSFILNQLLGQSTGFVVAPTHRPCTKGLWMWSSPVERTGPDGGKYYLVMLDTEGIDAWDQTGQYSVQIFSLAVLLSSLFVYNQMGGIDEAALDRLSLVTEMTKHIRVRAAAKGQSSTNGELAEFTPSFLWLLRDFYLQLEESGRKVSPREYLETALSAVPDASPGAVAKNQIRESIKSLFPDRDCFPLVRPMNNENKLQHLETVPAKDLRPEFREGLAKLVSLCFARAQPKRVGSQILNGPMLAGLTQAYVDAINKGAVPTIATAWQGVAESECRRAADEAEAEYHATFRPDVEPEDAALMSEHQRALAAAKQKFAQEAVGDKSIQAAHDAKWQASVERAYAQLRDRKLAEAKSQVESMINDIAMKFQAMSTNPQSSTSDLIAALEVFLADFSKTAGGPTKWNRLVEFLKTTFLSMVKRADADARARDAALTAKASEAEARLSLAKVEIAKLRTQAGNEEGRVAALTQQLEGAHKRRQEELAALRTQLEASASAASEQLNAEIRRLRQQLAAAEGGTAALSGNVEIEKRRNEMLTRQLQEAEAEGRNLRSLKAETESALQKALGDKDALETQVAELQSQLHVERERARSLEADIAAGQAAVSELEAETEREVAQLTKRARTQDGPSTSAHPAADDVMASEDALDIENMTIQEMKEWLIEHDFEAEVWELANRKTPRVKKADWTNLIASKVGTL